MNDADRRAFTESARRLVYWLARRFARGPADDLAQEGLLRVFQNCHLHDPALGSAATWVKWQVMGAVSEMGRSRRREKAKPFPVDANGAALEVIDPKAADPAAGVVTRDTAARVRQAVGTLPDRERQLVAMRYGLGTGDGATLAEAGTALGVSAARAGQVERRALGRLRDVLG